MTPYKMEVWTYDEGKRKIPTVIDTRVNMVVFQMQCDEGNENPYTFPLATAEKLALQIVNMLNHATNPNGEVNPDDCKFARDFIDVYGGFPRDQAVELLVRRQREVRHS